MTGRAVPRGAWPITGLPVLGALYTSADTACTVNTGACACSVAWLTQRATPTAAARRVICLPPPGYAYQDGSRSPQRACHSQGTQTMHSQRLEEGDPRNATALPTGRVGGKPGS